MASSSSSSLVQPDFKRMCITSETKISEAVLRQGINTFAVFLNTPIENFAFDYIKGKEERITFLLSYAQASAQAHTRFSSKVMSHFRIQKTIKNKNILPSESKSWTPKEWLVVGLASYGDLTRFETLDYLIKAEDEGKEIYDNFRGHHDHYLNKADLRKTCGWIMDTFGTAANESICKDLNPDDDEAAMTRYTQAASQGIEGACEHIMDLIKKLYPESNLFLWAYRRLFEMGRKVAYDYTLRRFLDDSKLITANELFQALCFFQVMPNGWCMFFSLQLQVLERWINELKNRFNEVRKDSPQTFYNAHLLHGDSFDSLLQYVKKDEQEESAEYLSLRLLMQYLPQVLLPIVFEFLIPGKSSDPQKDLAFVLNREESARIQVTLLYDSLLSHPNRGLFKEPISYFINATEAAKEGKESYMAVSNIMFKQR